MAGLYDDAFLARLHEAAILLAPRWGISQDAEVGLLNVSENATFLVEEPGTGRRIVLRLHRPGYHTRNEIASELVWIDALRRAGVVQTPEILPLENGEWIAGFEIDGGIRHAVAFAFIDGTEPEMGAELVNGFRELGAISARLHAHARVWRRPEGFVRKTWNFRTTVGPAPHWGDWRAAPGLGREGRRLLDQTCHELNGRLVRIGEGPERFGLIHGDLRLANLLVEGGRISVIDFDDCGFGWFMYDFAAAISFFETDPAIPGLCKAWVEGYRSVAPLSPEDEASIPTFVMLRRLLLTAWIASHAETPTARELGGAAYTEGTLALAEKFLTEAARV